MKKSFPVLLLLVALVSGSFYSCENGGTKSGSSYNEKSKPATEFTNKMALTWVDLMLDQVRVQRIGPPPAARAMGYLGVALYESVVHGIPDGHSMAGQLEGLDKLPVPDNNQEYDWPTVMNSCAYLVCDEGLARYVGPNTVNLVQLHDKMNHMQDSLVANAEVSARSKQYGKDLANALIEYMKTDMYDYTRENNIYESPSRAGDPSHPEYWEPTDIDKTAFEPYFGGLRPLGLDTTELCMQDPTIPFSQDPNSEFCKFCEKLYGIDTSFSEYDRITSLYWADCPVETYTPPGHWLKIAKQHVRKNNYNLAQTAELYAYLGMSEYNAAISVWKIKYKTNLLRPKTYISEILKKTDWEPYLETPPFPEYPSGHSGFSGAAATVLTHYFGEAEFVDSTNLVIGLYPRKFASFNAAAKEAAYSRMYGGIHYEAAILDGMTIGSCLANNLMKKIKLGSGGTPVAKN